MFLYSGTNDSVVHPNVVRKTAEFYMRLEANVTTQFALHSEHCQPTLDYGNTCSVLGSPYISRCNYDGAGAALAVLAGSPLKKRGTYVPSNLVEIKVRNNDAKLQIADFFLLFAAKSIFSRGLAGGSGLG